MNEPKDFKKPIIVSVSSIAEEKIYGFTRRNVFNPELSGNCNIKCCTVTGVVGAKSERHSHPGDEIVFTLEGENINYANEMEFPLRQNQALAISPGTLHTTRVTGDRTWQGLSFYCDQCYLIQRAQPGKRSRIIKKKLKKVASSTKNPDKQIIFSPLFNETHFMELLGLVLNKPLGGCNIVHKGETVYFIISGRCLLSWVKKKVVLKPGVAAAIPAGFIHTLSVEDNDSCTILAASCSSCSLFDLETELSDCP